MSDRSAATAPAAMRAAAASAAVPWIGLALAFAAALIAAWLAGGWQPTTPLEEISVRAETQRDELVSRLRLADRVLRSIAADASACNRPPLVLGAVEQRYFSSVSVARSGEPPVSLLGAATPAPRVTAGLARALDDAESGVVALPHNDPQPARFVMLRRLDGVANADTLLVAELAPTYLLEARHNDHETDASCLQDGSSTGLQCSSRRVTQAVRALGADRAGPMGPLRWRAGGEDWSAFGVQLDLRSPVTDGNWTVLAVDPPNAGAHTPWGRTGATALGAVVFAAVAGLAVLRSRRAAAARTGRAGADAEQELSHAPHAAVSRDRIEQMLERQKRVINAMSDIDRASLSRADADKLVRLAAGHLLECTGCDVVLIGVLDRDIPSSMSVLVAAGDTESAAAEQVVVDLSAVELLSLSPEGAWVRNIHGFQLLAPQTRAGVDGALLLPIHEDGKPIGIVSIGYRGTGQIGADESVNARALAGRLAAALTSAARALALYSHTHFDATTTLPNRQYLKEHLAQQIRQARRDQARLALLFVDLDGFKKVNATLGHSRGDMVLAEAASRMRACVREEDMVTRFGGDEFVIVLPRIAEGVDASRVANKLVESIAQPYVVGSDEHHLGCSIGISVFPDDAQTVDRILRNADSAMFSAKEAGRGRYMFFDAAVNRAAADRTELERDLRRALTSNEFSVVYQPQVDLRSGRIEGAEALVRWHHPVRGTVSPVEFIAVAERAGLIAQIGEFVMRTACAQFAAWDAQGLAPRRISVNVSGLEIARTDIVARVEAVLRDTGLRPMHLELELTEGVFLDHSEASLEKLHHLRERGVRIALDDFGTGYSSLSYLQRLPIDVLKIDQSFVRELGDNPDTRPIVRAILEVAHSLGKTVVAEGIETEQQRVLLTEWGCDIGQGYRWSRPLGATAFGEFVRQLNSVGHTAALVD